MVKPPRQEERKDPLVAELHPFSNLNSSQCVMEGKTNLSSPQPGPEEAALLQEPDLDGARPRDGGPSRKVNRMLFEPIRVVKRAARRVLPAGPPGPPTAAPDGRAATDDGVGVVQSAPAIGRIATGARSVKRRARGRSRYSRGPWRTSSTSLSTRAESCASSRRSSNSNRTSTSGASPAGVSDASWSAVSGSGRRQATTSWPDAPGSSRSSESSRRTNWLTTSVCR